MSLPDSAYESVEPTPVPENFVPPPVRKMDARAMLQMAKDAGQRAIDNGEVKPTEVSSAPESAFATEEGEEHNESQDLMLAASAIFDGGVSTFELHDGKVVRLFPATMDKLPKIMLFFGAVVNGLNPEGLARLVDTVVNRQKLAIQEGRDPNGIDLKEMATEEMIGKVFDHTALLSQLLAATFQFLPEMVSNFSDLTPEEYRKLSPDDGMLIAGGIFMQNYRFFTRILPPILTAFMQSWASKKGQTAGKKRG